MSTLPRNVVVVPIDFSTASQNAVQAALELAGDVSKLRLLHVLPDLEVVSPGVVWGEITNASRETAVRKHSVAFLQATGAAGATLHVRVGRPGHEITEFAEEQQADLIVISSHGYHGFRRMLLGSVAESVIRHAECAVLVLRRQDAE